tara:strand:+ start:1075 stop:1500 length:426 start_codon:yes stop_codon:yes gene_type:complete
MASELTITTAAAANGTNTLVGAWELRAGSHDTEGWLDGQATSGYPGSLDGFKPQNVADGGSESNNQGYAPAPKMALINCTGGSTNCKFTLGGGITSILSIFVTSGEASPGSAVLGTTESGLEVTVTGLANTKVADLMVLYN